MAIVIRLDLQMAKRKIRLTDLAEQVGLSVPNLSVLKNGRARAVRFSTLEALCRVLRCQPGDLLEYQPGADVDREEDGGSGER